MYCMSERCHGIGSGVQPQSERMMPLVDYASSSDDEEENREQETAADTKEQLDSPPPVPLPLPHKRAAAPAKKETIAHPSITSVEKLPDASLLLNSPTVSSTSSAGDHASRVASAMAESASRKRESNAPSSSATRSKVPRGTLPHAKGVPDTDGGLLLPPQLRGRSNVVTEDISKLFVRRQTDPSSS